MLFSHSNKFMAFALSGMVTIATITTPYSNIFGTIYNSSKDYACCENNQLVIHHYYSINIFWIKVSEGFTREKITKIVNLGGCSIKCND